MAAKDPFDQFLESTHELVSLLRSKEFQKLDHIPQAFEESLSVLENYVQLYKTFVNRALEKAHIDIEELQPTTPPDDLPIREKKRLTRMNKVKNEVDEELKIADAKLSAIKKQKPEEKQKDRKRKFDRSGARKDWKPL